MKARAYFEKITKQGKINASEDFTKFLDTLKDDQEIPDVWVNMFENEFLTRERAKADDKIYDTIRGEVLDGVKLNVREIVPFLSPEDQEAILKEPKGFNQLKMLKPAFEKAFQAVKEQAPPSNEEKEKEYKKQLKEMADKLAAQKNDFEAKEKETLQRYESEKKSLLLDFSLNNKMGEFTFADEFKEVKPTLVKSILDKIKGENVLVLDEATGSIAVHEKTETAGVTKQKYNGNDPVTLDKLLEEPLKPFLKKNNAGTPPAQGRESGSGRSTTPQIAKDPQKMTLAELNRMQMA